MKKQTLAATLIILATLLISVLIAFVGFDSYDNTVERNDENTPSQTEPELPPLEIEVKVTPWGDMYRKEPDCKEDFSVNIVHPNQEENFTTNTFNIIMNAGAYYWIVEKAYYTSDLFTGERWIPISKLRYTVDLQKTFTFSLVNVPNGQHELTLTVIFHEGTRNQAKIAFNVLT